MQKSFDYTQAKTWLLSHIGKKRSGRNPEKDLFHMRRFLSFLGNPQRKYKSAHIAGTSGKGSTTLFLQQLLSSCGFSTGAYTKPYLQEPIEKLRIESRLISKKDFSELVFFLKEKYRQFEKRFPSSAANLGYKELWMALGHLFFAGKGLDFVVIETSMGGAYDSSNLLLPEVCIITTVDFDHTKYLGESLQSIAWHKAGIIKKNVPVVVGKMRDEALRVVRDKARKSCAEMLLLGRDFDFRIKNCSWQGSVFDLWVKDKSWRDVFIPVVGDFQVYNCSLAVAAGFVLSEKFRLLLPDDLSRVFADMKIPGRMELMQKDPLVIFDVAHNRQKLSSAFAFLVKNYAEVADRTLILGLLKGKDPEFFLQRLSGFFQKIIITQPKVYGREIFPADELFKIAKKYKERAKLHCFKEPLEALEYALKETKKAGLVFATGSVFLIGNLREFYFPEPEGMD